MAEGSGLTHLSEKITKVTDIHPNIQEVIQNQLPTTAPNDTIPFKDFMENHTVAKPASSDTNHAVQLNQQTQLSLIAEISRVNKGIRISELVGTHPQQFQQNFNRYANKSIAQVEIGKDYLRNSTTTIKPSVGYLLENKLHNVNSDLKSVYQTMKMEYPDGVPAKTLLKPVQKFFGYLVNGQTQMQQLKYEVNKIDGESFSMAQMLSVQIKMAHIQQELEFFTGLLNKTLESTKTLMNVQI
jgi:hypothetical protein